MFGCERIHVKIKVLSGATALLMATGAFVATPAVSAEDFPVGQIMVDRVYNDTVIGYAYSGSKVSAKKLLGKVVCQRYACGYRSWTSKAMKLQYGDRVVVKTKGRSDRGTWILGSG